MATELSAAFPLLSLIVWLPTIGALLLCRASPKLAPCLGVGIAGADLVACMFMLWRFDRQHSGPQLAEHLGSGWLNYHLAVDGLSILFLPLAALLAMLVLVLRRDSPEPRPHPAPVLVYLSTLMLLLTAQDLMLFWLAAVAETTLILAWIRRAPASAPFLVGALVLLLTVTLLLGWQQAEASGRWSFDLLDLAYRRASGAVQTAAGLMLLLAVAIRLPLFPLHGWFAPALQHAAGLGLAPVFFAGLKIGIYTLLRWALPLFPQAVAQWASYVVPVALAGLFYGAALALVQLHLGRLLAFAVVSQNAILLMGLLTPDPEGLAGTLLMSASTGLACGGLLLAGALVYRHTGSLWLPRLGGLFDVAPGLALAFLIGAITLMAMPGTPGFDAAHLLLEGTLRVHSLGVSIALASANVLTAGLLLWTFQRAFLARPQRVHHQAPGPLSRCGKLVMVIVSLALLSGFYSRPYLDLVNASLLPALKPYAAYHAH